MALCLPSGWRAGERATKNTRACSRSWQRLRTRQAARARATSSTVRAGRRCSRRDFFARPASDPSHAGGLVRAASAPVCMLSSTSLSRSCSSRSEYTYCWSSASCMCATKPSGVLPLMLAVSSAEEGVRRPRRGLDGRRAGDQGAASATSCTIIRPRTPAFPATVYKSPPYKRKPMSDPGKPLARCSLLRVSLSRSLSLSSTCSLSLLSLCAAHSATHRAYEKMVHATRY